MPTESSDKAKKILKDLEEDTLVGNPDHYYVKLIIYKARRNLLALAMILFFVMIVTLIAKDLHQGTSWYLMSLPITVGGLMMCLVPPTEEWEYKPWQARPRRYELHQIQRE